VRVGVTVAVQVNVTELDAVSEWFAVAVASVAVLVNVSDSDTVCSLLSESLPVRCAVGLSVSLSVIDFDWLTVLFSVGVPPVIVSVSVNVRVGVSGTLNEADEDPSYDEESVRDRMAGMVRVWLNDLERDIVLEREDVLVQS